MQIVRSVSIGHWLLCCSVAIAQTSSIGSFSSHGDIGAVKHPGSVRYDSDDDSYMLSGSGTNMWARMDECQFVWKKMSGDFILDAQAAFLDEDVHPKRDPHRKIGWMVRKSLDSESPYVDIAIHGDGSLTSLQFRRSQGAITEQVESIKNLPNVIQLSKKGKKYTMAVANYGELLTSKGRIDGRTTEVELDLGEEVYVGLFVCSHNADVVEKAVFRNVRITIPAKDDFRPYRDYIGSRLELMELATGHRKVIKEVHDSFQAPNWTRDGKRLIYNRNGRLFTLELANGRVELLNTGDIVNNNNDHVLSFDGRRIGISSSVGPNRKSTIFSLPILGGTPKQITPSDNHSYLHSWSPDDKHLIYTAQRNGDFDIYRIPVDGGEEVNLTRSPGLDDGSEYSPDGRSIYFNSVRTGKMQIWKMDADGSNQTQVTNDEFNNWFPHVSPDGKSILIISFPADIDPNDHPFYKNVYLRQMPIGGGPLKVIAYLYGGQGSINVPSFSPDGKQIAFVSNSDGIPPKD